jgi:hypothetical protein
VKVLTVFVGLGEDLELMCGQKETQGGLNGFSKGDGTAKSLGGGGWMA